MKKYFLLYSLSVAAAVLIVNEFWPLQFYGSDGYYFWGLAKFIAAGKVENTDVFWHMYPAGFSLMLGFLLGIIPNISYEHVALGLLCSYLILGPLIFIKVYKKESGNSLIKGLFFFYFAASGFYIVEYLIGEIVLPQAMAFLLLPLYPYLLFSHKKKALLVLLTIILYFLHSATLLFILMTSALCVFNKKTRKQTLWAAILLSPFLTIKGLHLLMLLSGWNYGDLPLNHFLGEYKLGTYSKIFTETYKNLPLYQVLLSGVPIFFWLLFVKNKKPEFAWYRNLALISFISIIFYTKWSELLPFIWPRERYLGFLWLPIGLSFPYFFSEQIKFKKAVAVFASLFIAFQFGMAFYRETRVNEEIEKQIAWLSDLKKYETENIVILYKGNAGTYSYGIFPPSNIYQVFPTAETRSKTINKRFEIPGFLNEEVPENIEELLLNAEIDLIIADKDFNEFFKKLQNYQIASSFNGEAYAYILSK